MRPLTRLRGVTHAVHFLINKWKCALCIAMWHIYMIVCIHTRMQISTFSNQHLTYCNLSLSCVISVFWGGGFYQFPQVLCFIVPPAAALGMFPLHAENQSVGFPTFPEPPPLLPITISSGRSGMILLCVRLQTPFMITAPQVKTSRTTCSRANLTQRLPFKLFVTFWEGGGGERHCKHYNLIS